MEKPLRNRSSVRFFKVLLTVVALAYLFCFGLSLHFFPQIWSSPFHPENPRFLIMNLSVFFDGVLTGLLYLAIIYQIYRILSLIKRGEPFSEENPKRIRKIAYCTFGLAAVNAIAESVRHISMHGVADPYFWPSMTQFLQRAVQTVLFGTGILIVGFVLEVGVALKQDQDLTV
jgi:pilus assembly protein TadC